MNNIKKEIKNINKFFWKNMSNILFDIPLFYNSIYLNIHILTNKDYDDENKYYVSMLNNMLSEPFDDKTIKDFENILNKSTSIDSTFNLSIDYSLRFNYKFTFLDELDLREHIENIKNSEINILFKFISYTNQNIKINLKSEKENDFIVKEFVDYYYYKSREIGVNINFIYNIIFSSTIEYVNFSLEKE